MAATIAIRPEAMIVDADLSISKNDGETRVNPGDTITYTIVAANDAGCNDVSLAAGQRTAWKCEISKCEVRLRGGALWGKQGSLFDYNQSYAWTFAGGRLWAFRDIFQAWTAKPSKQTEVAMKIRVIIPIVGTQFNPAIEEEVESVRAPDCEVSYVNLAVGTPSIESRYAESLNTPDIVRLAREAAAEGVDGIFIDCFAGAAEVVRELVDIPVIGALDSAVYMAEMLSQKFSIVTVDERVVPIILGLLRDMGVGESLASIRDVGIPVLDLGNEALLKKRLDEQSALAVEKDGAQSIVLGCTGMLNMVRYLQGSLRKMGWNIPVIDPTTASIAMLQALIRNGLTQSRLTYFEADDKVVHAK